MQKLWNSRKLVPAVCFFLFIVCRYGFGLLGGVVPIGGKDFKSENDQPILNTKDVEKIKEDTVKKTPRHAKPPGRRSSSRVHMCKFVPLCRLKFIVKLMM